MHLTPANILTIAPAANLDFVSALIANQSIITLPDEEWPDFFGQIATETSGFNRLEENLFYTTVKRIRQVWPSRFKSDGDAAAYVRAPQKLANLVYGGRLGNTGPNDGWNYRGSSCIQTTGKNNFTQVKLATGVDCVNMPDLLRAFPAALQAAVVFWKMNNLGRLLGDTVKITKAIQGGTGGLGDRIEYTSRARKAFAMGAGAWGATAKVLATSNMLRVGSIGPDVLKLQTRLRDLHYDFVGNLDSKFAAATEDAVKAFQQANGLIADGVAGPKTLDVLYSTKAVQHQSVTLPEPSGLDKLLSWIVGKFQR